MAKFLSEQRNIQSITMKYSVGRILYVCKKLAECIVLWRKKSCQLGDVSIQYHFTVRALPVWPSSIQRTILERISPQMYSLYIQDEVLFTPQPIHLCSADVRGSEDVTRSCGQTNTLFHQPKVSLQERVLPHQKEKIC